MKILAFNNSVYELDGFAVVPVGRWNLEGYDGPIDGEIDPRDIQKTLDEGAEVYWSVFGHILHGHPLNGPVAGGEETITDHPTEADAIEACLLMTANLESRKRKNMRTTNMKRIIADDNQSLLLCNESRTRYWLRRQWYRLQLRLSWRVTLFIPLVIWGLYLCHMMHDAPV